MKTDLIREFQEELGSLLKYWARYPVDQENGGFYGKIDHLNRVGHQAPKGAVLNARILWFFSAAYNCLPSPENLEWARRSYDYIKDYFIDRSFGGVFWSVDFQGKPLDTKKQVYALAFTIYGLSEFYKASRHEEALALAIALYEEIEKHSFDAVNNGYLEAFGREWTRLEDMRLSAKDANEKKTMNTHLHIIEAYTNLYTVWPDKDLESRIRNLLDIFDLYILNKETFHLNLFFDEIWESKADIISFGHDIEASWLLPEAAEVTGNESLIRQWRSTSAKIAAASLQGLDENGALNYEQEEGHLNREKHWWVQAEAMVGFLNAFQITGDRHYYDRFEKCWFFIKGFISDRQRGEWLWGVNEDLSVMPGQDKVGIWKCPYHNGRACLEIIRRLS